MEYSPHSSHCCVFCLFSFDAAVDPAQTLENGHSEERSALGIFLYQSTALLKKRLLTFGRDKKMWIFVVFMPLLFVGIGTLILLAFNQKDQPALALSPQVHVYVGQCRISCCE